jgi:hypothetical protein
MKARSTILLLALGTVILAMPSLAEQTCNPDIAFSKPSSRYELLAEGTEVLDRATGQIWQRCSLGQTRDGAGCAGAAGTITWQEALAQASGDWRLPNVKELRSLIEYACVPTINGSIFPDVPVTHSWQPAIHYWTASPFAQHPLQSWGVNFTNGADYPGTPRTYPMWVRLVRTAD